MTLHIEKGTSVASEDNKVVLQYPGGEYEMDIKQSTEGDSGFDISKLRNETGLVTFDPGYTSTGSTESKICLLYTSPSPRDRQKSRMPSSA